MFRFRYGFPEDWKNLVSLWQTLEEEKKRHAEMMTSILNSTASANMSLATVKGIRYLLTYSKRVPTT